MAELQQPDVLGSYLSNFRAAQQDRMAQQDRQRTIQRQDAQDERGEAEHDFTMMQRKNEIIARTAMAADTPEKWQQLVPAAAQQLGWSGELPGFDQRNRIIAESQSVADQIKQKMEEREFGLKQGLTNAQIAAQRANAAQSYASADAARALASRRGGLGSEAVLPTRAQTAEDEDIGAIQTAQSINSQLDAVNAQIDSGELRLGPVGNIVSRAQNFLGASDEASTNYATMMSTLERMRNDSLILNKGVQTEGDAVRAWNALIANVNDPKVVKAQIARIKRLNQIAQAQKLQLINIRRQRNQAAPFDPAQIAPPQIGATVDDFSDVDAILGLK